MLIADNYFLNRILCNTCSSLLFCLVLLWFFNFSFKTILFIKIFTLCHFVCIVSRICYSLKLFVWDHYFKWLYYDFLYYSYSSVILCCFFPSTVKLAEEFALHSHCIVSYFHHARLVSQLQMVSIFSNM